jgi:hypothetical protein
MHEDDWNRDPWKGNPWSLPEPPKGQWRVDALRYAAAILVLPWYTVVWVLGVLKKRFAF